MNGGLLLVVFGWGGKKKNGKANKKKLISMLDTKCTNKQQIETESDKGAGGRAEILFGDYL